MIPNRHQAVTSLAALKRDADSAVRWVPAWTSDDSVILYLTERGGCVIRRTHIPEEVLATIDWTPDIRLDHLERAHRLVEQAHLLPAQHVAERIVDRLVCDRLR